MKMGAVNSVPKGGKIMNTYLAIITTVLVMTQIIRVTQNAMQLRHLGEVHKYDDFIKKVYEKIERAADKYLEDIK